MKRRDIRHFLIVGIDNKIRRDKQKIILFADNLFVPVQNVTEFKYVTLAYFHQI